jgi:hypothetical protein
MIYATNEPTIDQLLERKHQGFLSLKKLHGHLMQLKYPDPLQPRMPY